MVVFAVLVALGARAVGKAFNVLTQTVWWMQRAAGVVCLAIGIHYSLKYIFEIPLFWDRWLEVVYQLIWRTS